MSLERALDGLEAYIKLQISEGVREVEVFGKAPRSAKPVPAPKPAAATAKPEKPARSVQPAVSPKVGRIVTPEEIVAARRKLDEISEKISLCKGCQLSKTRTNLVPGQGNPCPEVMFIGEAPGEDEDLQGLAFVGRAGQLLTKMIEAMGFTRDEVFIGNILKCRPPENRRPLPEEIEVCIPFLKQQIAVLKPLVIVSLGATAIQGLLKIEEPISRVRGKWLSYEGIDLMPTFHPSYLLRNPAAKKEVWEDLKAVLQRIGRTPPPQKKPTP